MGILNIFKKKDERPLDNFICKIKTKRVPSEEAEDLFRAWLASLALNELKVNMEIYRDVLEEAHAGFVTDWDAVSNLKNAIHGESPAGLTGQYRCLTEGFAQRLTNLCLDFTMLYTIEGRIKQHGYSFTVDALINDINEEDVTLAAKDDITHWKGDSDMTVFGKWKRMMKDAEDSTFKDENPFAEIFNFPVVRDEARTLYTTYKRNMRNEKYGFKNPTSVHEEVTAEHMELAKKESGGDISRLRILDEYGALLDDDGNRIEGRFAPHGNLISYVYDFAGMFKGKVNTMPVLLPIYYLDIYHDPTYFMTPEVRQGHTGFVTADYFLKTWQPRFEKAAKEHGYYIPKIEYAKKAYKNDGAPALFLS